MGVQTFEWGDPDVEAVKTFVAARLSFDAQTIATVLEPVVKVWLAGLLDCRLKGRPWPEHRSLHPPRGWNALLGNTWLGLGFFASYLFFFFVLRFASLVSSRLTV